RACKGRANVGVSRRSPTRRSSDLDRLGGRTDYTGPLARELPGLPITVIEQGPARSVYEVGEAAGACRIEFRPEAEDAHLPVALADRKSTRLNSSHVKNSYAVFCLK